MLFTQAAICYLDFLSEYHYLIGYSDEEERLNAIESTLLECWKYAPYIRRVSDFERFLGVLLEKRSSHLSTAFKTPHEKLGQLNHTQRFLLVARTFHNWPYRWAALGHPHQKTRDHKRSDRVEVHPDRI